MCARGSGVEGQRDAEGQRDKVAEGRGTRRMGAGSDILRARGGVERGTEEGTDITEDGVVGGVRRRGVGFGRAG